MIKTIKENYYMVIKIILNQLGMDFFGIVMFIAGSSAGMGEGREHIGSIAKIATSVFAILFYMVLLYTMSKDEGLKDEIRIESGRMKPQPLKFLWLSLAANVVNILLGIIVTVGTVMGANAPGFVVDAVTVAIGGITLTEGMYLGVLQEVFNMNGFACILIAAPAIITCTLGYYIGSQGGFSKMMEKKAKKLEEKENK